MCPCHWICVASSVISTVNCRAIVGYRSLRLACWNANWKTHETFFFFLFFFFPTFVISFLAPVGSCSGAKMAAIGHAAHCTAAHCTAPHCTALHCTNRSSFVSWRLFLLGRLIGNNERLIRVRHLRRRYASIYADGRPFSTTLQNELYWRNCQLRFRAKQLLNRNIDFIQSYLEKRR